MASHTGVAPFLCTSCRLTSLNTGLHGYYLSLPGTQRFLRVERVRPAQKLHAAIAEKVGVSIPVGVPEITPVILPKGVFETSVSKQNCLGGLSDAGDHFLRQENVDPVAGVVPLIAATPGGDDYASATCRRGKQTVVVFPGTAAERRRIPGCTRLPWAKYRPAQSFRCVGLVVPLSSGTCSRVPGHTATWLRQYAEDCFRTGFGSCNPSPGGVQTARSARSTAMLAMITTNSVRVKPASAACDLEGNWLGLVTARKLSLISGHVKISQQVTLRTPASPEHLDSAFPTRLCTPSYLYVVNYCDRRPAQCG